MKKAIVAGFFCLVLACGTRSFAQVGTQGSILGVVTDSSGAAVSGAQVVIVNLDTGLQRVVRTDSAGAFEIPALPQGFYSVTISHSGFTTWAVQRTELTVGEHKRLSPALAVGEVTEKVTVTASAELMQTETGSVNSLIETKQIIDTPLISRDVVELTRLAPGTIYQGKNADEMSSSSIAMGPGTRSDQTQFSLDGLSANTAVDEHGAGIPTVDAIAEFEVQTSSFSADHGRDPVQVVIVTKSGTNNLHGSVWEFLRNDALNARNYFATSKPALKRNQFGFTVGGPIIKNKTHFFGSYEGLRVRQEQIYNSPTISPAYLKGDFSSLGHPIVDPQTGSPFPGNVIPANRISSASQFFFPYILLPNSPGNLFSAVTPVPDDSYQYMVRIDQQISNRQKIYGRWFASHESTIFPLYKPGVNEYGGPKGYNVGINYDFNITSRTLLNVNIGSLGQTYQTQSALRGKENLVQEAGISGFPTAGRSAEIGLPDAISFTGYTGISTAAFGAPYKLWWHTLDGTVSLHQIWAKHSIVAGYQYDDSSVKARQGEGCSMGTFDFNGQYTGDGFADFLLGYPDNSGRCYPLDTFGLEHAPYSALFVQDSWKVHSRVTLDLGLRWDYWHAKSFVNGAASTFDPTIGKAIAGETSDGNVDLNAQTVAPYLAAATAGLWVPASQAHVPYGLFEPSGYVSPRVGIAWRPFGKDDLVVRGGYGIFTSSVRGNFSASQIAGPPYWSNETQFWDASQLQPWATAWPANPQDFVTPSISAVAYNIKPNKTYEWNASIQRSLPFRSALTVAYVGNKGLDLDVYNSLNEVRPGNYPNLQAAHPYPQFGSIQLYQNDGKAWYNSLQLKWERRFAQGFSGMVSYAYSKSMSENGGGGAWTTPTPFAPKGYNRGRDSDACFGQVPGLSNASTCDANADHRHILAVNALWELPIGRTRRYGQNLNPVLNGFVGGWEFSSLYNFISGAALSFDVPGATLGNGWDTRPNLVGDLKLAHPSAKLWFNPQALAAPPAYTFGDSGMGIFDGPGYHEFNTALLKNFYFREDKYLQFRWEMFNAINHVNLANPVTSIGLATTGQIFSAGPARQMQLALKFIF
jgi:hypothetical protein